MYFGVGRGSGGFGIGALNALALKTQTPAQMRMTKERPTASPVIFYMQLPRIIACGVFPHPSRLFICITAALCFYLHLPKHSMPAVPPETVLPELPRQIPQHSDTAALRPARFFHKAKRVRTAAA